MQVSERSLHRRAALLVGVVSLFSFSYFYEGGGWNQNSRFDFLRAIVEQHTFQIDAYHENTSDKAHFEGHYYSEKAPGLVFLAAPVAMAVRPVLRVSGIDPGSPRGEVAFSYFVTVGAVGLPTVLGAVCLFFIGLRLGANVSGAAFGAVAMSIGTPVWAYASLFWAHALVGACLVFAFAAAVKLRDVATSQRDFLLGVAVGLAAGWATVTEYPAAPVAVIPALLALSQVWPHGKSARLAVIGGIALGAGLCVVVLLTYLYTTFHSLRPSYSYYDPNSFTFMQQRGYLGLTYPHVDALLKLFFNCRRGLFFLAPVTFAAPFGLHALWKRGYKAEALAAASIVAYYFLFNASFYEWRGGLSFGPRYAGASIPILCIGLSTAWTRASRHWRSVMIGLALCSVFFALMAISTDSQLSVVDSCPLFHQAWPAFWSGHLAVNTSSMLTLAEAGSSADYGAFNLGQKLGLHGLWSLLPLFGGWIVAAVAWTRIRAHSV